MESKVKSFAISSLRRSSYRWKARSEAMKRARVGRGLYKCASCNGIFRNKDINVDHIAPVIPVTGWISFDSFIERLFCDVDGLQIICSSCHDAKTSIENTIRKLNKQKLIKKAKKKIVNKKK